MTQPISVVIPVYDGVTQIDFTGPHQFLSRRGVGSRERAHGGGLR